MEGSEVRQDVQAALRDHIRCGHLRPGDGVPISMLARQWRVSESPVRDAVWRSVGEGWIVAGVHGGFSVWLPSVDGLRALYQCLEIISIDVIESGPMPSHTFITDIAIAEWGDLPTALLVDALARIGNDQLCDIALLLLRRRALFDSAEHEMIRPERKLTLDWEVQAPTRSQWRNLYRSYWRRRQTLAGGILAVVSERRRLRPSKSVRTI